MMDRRVDVYLNSKKQKDRWKKLAGENGLSLSKFAQYAVEQYISQKETEEPNTAEKIAKLEDEIQSLSNENERLERIIKTYKDEINEYKMMQFSNKNIEGKRNYNKRLIDKIKSDSPVNEEEILRHLGISKDDGDKISWVSTQLELLSQYGFIEYGSEGWMLKDEE